MACKYWIESRSLSVVPVAAKSSILASITHMEMVSRFKAQLPFCESVRKTLQAEAESAAGNRRHEYEEEAKHLTQASATCTQRMSFPEHYLWMRSVGKMSTSCTSLCMKDRGYPFCWTFFTRASPSAMPHMSCHVGI